MINPPHKKRTLPPPTATPIGRDQLIIKQEPVASTSGATPPGGKATPMIQVIDPAQIVIKPELSSSVVDDNIAVSTDDDEDEELPLRIDEAQGHASGHAPGHAHASTSKAAIDLEQTTLDYVVNEDGSCTCKLCGEVVASRTHWYRHKYKVINCERRENCG